jgi:hypothetical protein
MEQRYNVYFAGQILPGQNAQLVEQNLAKLFNANPAALAKLFSGKPQLVKRECNKATALKYKQAMENAGAQPVIKLAEAPPEKAPAKAPAPTPEPPAQSTADRIAALMGDSTPTSTPRPEPTTDTATPAPGTAAPSNAATDTLSLAADGNEILRPDEKPRVNPVQVDTSALAVEAAGSLIGTQQREPSASAPDTTHLSISQAGEVIPNLACDDMPVEPDISAIGLTPQGTDLRDCAAQQAPAPELNLAGLDLSPPGSEVLEERYRSQSKESAPATDHISLADKPVK